MPLASSLRKRSNRSIVERSLGQKAKALWGFSLWVGVYCLGFGCHQGADSKTTLVPQPYGSGVINWQPCPEGLPGEGTECALLRVPINWESTNPSSPTTTTLLRRLRAPNGEAEQNLGNGAALTRPQFWALDGGPGMAGDSFFDPAFVSFVHKAGYDLYVPTHRGSGYADALRCPEFESPQSVAGPKIAVEELESCIDSLFVHRSQLKYWTSREAAEDVLYSIRRVTSEGAGQKTTVALFGGSYGTYWVQRVLQKQSGEVELAIMDSIVSLDASLHRVDSHADQAGRELLSRCDADSFCSQLFQSQFGESALQSAKVVQARLVEGRGCNDLPLSDAQLMLYTWLSGHPDTRALIPSWVFRMRRCSQEDRQALSLARQTFESPSSGVGGVREVQKTSVGNGPTYSSLLNHLELSAELNHPETNPSNGGTQSLLFSSGGDRHLADYSRELERILGRDFRRPLSIELGSSSVPILLTQGQLDPLDPPRWAIETAKRWGAVSSEHQPQLFLFPNAGHATVRYTGMPDGQNCTLALWSQFLQSRGRAKLDASCVQSFSPISFDPEGLKEAAKRWYGVESAY